MKKHFICMKNQKVYNFVKLLEKRLWALEQELEDKKMQIESGSSGENRSKYDDVEENSGVVGTKKSIDELCSTIANLRKNFRLFTSFLCLKMRNIKNKRYIRCRLLIFL